MLRLGSVAIISFLFAGLGILLPISLAKVSSPLTLDGVEITFSTTGVVLPCLCLKRSISGDGRVGVHAVADTDVPLNYKYSMTGGRIIGEGPDVVWDFNDGFAPGEYSLTLVVDDGIGNFHHAVTKTISVVEPDCDCPCECPSIAVYSHNSSVKRGATLDFEARVGGATAGIRYHWTVENGTITSGQGTPRIEVAATSKKGIGEVVAKLEIEIDNYCYCPLSQTESVPIAERSIVRKFPLSVYRLILDETTLYIDCKRGNPAPGSPKSKDLVIDVETIAESNSILDRLQYTYSVSGGSVVGSGRKVNWDLTGLTYGTYEISATVDDGKKTSETKTRTITLADPGCVWDPPECPSVAISSATRVGNSDDYIVQANVQGVSPGDVRYSWETTGGKILAGQGTRSVRVRARWSASDPTPEVKLSLLLPPEFKGCSKEAGTFLAHPTPQ